MLDITKETQDKAIALRSEGMSYSKIVTELAEFGATEWWVKKVCKDVKPNKQATLKQQAVEKVYDLAIRDIGVKDNELYPIYLELYGFTISEEDGGKICNITQEQKSEIRKAVRTKAEKEGKIALFVPSWMSRTKPKDSNKLMLKLAGELHDRCEEMVSYFLDQYPDVWSVGVERELVYLAFRGVAPEGVERRCERNSIISASLENRDDCDITAPNKKAIRKYMDELKDQTPKKDPVCGAEWEEILEGLGY